MFASSLGEKKVCFIILGLHSLAKSYTAVTLVLKKPKRRRGRTPRGVGPKEPHPCLRPQGPSLPKPVVREEVTPPRHACSRRQAPLSPCVCVGPGGAPHRGGFRPRPVTGAFGDRPGGSAAARPEDGTWAPERNGDAFLLLGFRESSGQGKAPKPFQLLAPEPLSKGEASA